jgi:hypothetical protein
MLLLTIALAVVIWLLITHEPKPKPPPRDPSKAAKHADRMARRVQVRQFLVAGLAVALGMSLTLSPVVGDVVASGATKTAGFLTSVREADLDDLRPSLPGQLDPEQQAEAPAEDSR